MTARASGAIVVGSKNFTEQVILGELLAQTIERDTGLPVERRLNLGGTLICDRALAAGDIDVYVEYTGTALTAIFHQPVSTDRRRRVRRRCASCTRAADGRCCRALGFDNTFAILVRGERRARARAQDDRRCGAGGADVAGGIRLRVPRAAGRLSRAWRRRTACSSRAPPRVMDLTLSYRALAAGQVDLIAGDATAGLIKALDLFRLEDNRHYFPPYDAAPVARAATLLRYPQVRTALERLAGRISADDMQAMNYAADVAARGRHRNRPPVSELDTVRSGSRTVQVAPDPSPRSFAVTCRPCASTRYRTTARAQP